MAERSKQAVFRTRWVDRKTRRFVAPNATGAVRVRQKVPAKPAKPRRVFRDSHGKFTTPQKAKRSQAAKKAAETRRLSREGIKRVETWKGVARDGSFTDYEYEKFSLPDLDSAIVGQIVRSRRLGGRRFLFNGAATFRDSRGKLFTNNTSLYLDTDNGGFTKVVDELAALLIAPSNPLDADRSKNVDVEAMFVVIRYQREK